MKTNVKTIDIQTKEWFDKVNGNSYFSSLITVNYGMKDSKEYKLPFQYGYGEASKHEALKLLINEGLIKSRYHQDLKDNNIIIRYNKQTGCKKSELKNI